MRRVMKTQAIGLSWIVVNDFKKAVKFYTDTVGLKLVEMNEEWGWAELAGYSGEGSRLGIAQSQKGDENPVKPGQNAVMTFTVDDIDKAIQHVQKQGAQLIGKVEEVPGHVKMQSIRDSEGNIIQIVQLIEETGHSDHHHCCGGH